MGLLPLLVLVGAVCVLAPVAIVVTALLLIVRAVVATWRAARALVGGPRTAPASTSLTAGELASSAPIIYFVHGTFAPGAAWTATDALVAQTIAAALAAAGCAPVFQRLEWSGDNTVAARTAAIVELEARLGGIFAADARRRVFLVGHSHGGNVAIKAAERFADRDGLAVVTLATPFIIAQVRDDAAAVGTMMRIVVCVCLAVTSAIVAGLLPFPWLLLPAVSAAVALVLAVRAVLPRADAPDGPTAALLRSVPDLDAVKALIPKTLIVSRSGDEADGVLKLASFLNGWVAQTLRGSALVAELSNLLADARRAGNARAQRAASGSGRRLMVPTVFEAKAAFGYVRRMRELGAEIVGVLAGTLLLYMLRVAVGTTSGLLATTVVVTSSETPPGEWRHVQTLASIAPTGTVMSHSQIYDDPHVCQVVAAWVSTRSAAQATRAGASGAGSAISSRVESTESQSAAPTISSPIIGTNGAV
jgi:pimeloyl-ACP methyl ester carboxylesterase